jgi:hypothetical protein
MGIGDLSRSSESSFFNGSIDEVAVYPYALTAAQVQSHYFAAGRDTRVLRPLTGGVRYYDGTQWRQLYAKRYTGSGLVTSVVEASTSGGVVVAP